MTHRYLPGRALPPRENPMETKLQLVPEQRDRANPDGGDEFAGQIPFVVPPRRWRRRRGPRTDGRWASRKREEHGAVTAEYAIIIMAAVAFAGLLVAILRSSEVRAMLMKLVEDALAAAG